jgi:C4-type Zn-finger protein
MIKGFQCPYCKNKVDEKEWKNINQGYFEKEIMIDIICEKCGKGYNIEIVREYKFKSYPIDSELQQAVYAGNIDQVKTVLKENMLKLYRNNEINLAIEAADRYGHKAICKLLTKFKKKLVSKEFQDIIELVS